VSDRFGKYAKVPNPPADQEHKLVTIDKAYWPDAKDAPAEIRQIEERRLREIELARNENLALWPNLEPDRRFYVHCREWLGNAGEYLQVKSGPHGVQASARISPNSRASFRHDAPPSVER
jgi:hypothetical protein